jgi:hypothetical protein
MALVILLRLRNESFVLGCVFAQRSFAMLLTVVMLIAFSTPAKSQSTGVLQGRVVKDFRFQVGDISQTVRVTPTTQLVERATVSVGHVMDGKMVQEIPFSYEGLRQRQGLDLNSLVLSDAERASTTDPMIARLIEFIPRANFVDSSGASRQV